MGEQQPPTPAPTLPMDRELVAAVQQEGGPDMLMALAGAQLQQARGVMRTRVRRAAQRSMPTRQGRVQRDRALVARLLMQVGTMVALVASVEDGDRDVNDVDPPFVARLRLDTEATLKENAPRLVEELERVLAEWSAPQVALRHLPSGEEIPVTVKGPPGR